MRAKLIVDGHEFDIDILDPKLQELITPPKKTGYERAMEGFGYYFVGDDNRIYPTAEFMSVVNYEHYNEANYYSDKIVAENNARADKLMRQLRRFAVEHRDYEMNLNDWQSIKYYIYYDSKNSKLLVGCSYVGRSFGTVHFRSRENAELAIEKFHDELMWYFTEYKDSL